MRAYVMTTGTVFGLLTVAHILRMVEEGPTISRDPSYLLITGVAAGLCIWAVLVLRRKSS